MLELNVSRIKSDLASKIPLVRTAAISNLTNLVRVKAKVLDPEDPQLRELVALLASPAVRTVGGKIKAVEFSEADSLARGGLQRTLNGMSVAARSEVQGALARANQMIDAAHRHATGNEIK